jgi:hypothetical protein
MDEQQFGKRVRQILGKRAIVEARAAERLRAARERALARQRREPLSALEWAHETVAGLGGWRGVSARIVVPLAALVLGLSVLHVWQQKQRLGQLAEIDAMLLAGELPLDAYLDRGFQNWLKRRAEGK